MSQADFRFPTLHQSFVPSARVPEGVESIWRCLPSNAPARWTPHRENETNEVLQLGRDFHPVPGIPAGLRFAGNPTAPARLNSRGASRRNRTAFLAYKASAFPDGLERQSRPEVTRG